MDTKHDKVVKREELPPINFQGHSNKFSSEFMWRIRNIISSLAEDQWVSNWTTWWLILNRLQPLNSHDPLTMWPTYSHVTTWKKLYLLPTKLYRVVTSGRSFRTQTPKSQSTSCFFFVCFFFQYFTHLKLMLPFYTSWKHQKIYPFEIG